MLRPKRLRAPHHTTRQSHQGLSDIVWAGMHELERGATRDECRVFVNHQLRLNPETRASGVSILMPR